MRRYADQGLAVLQGFKTGSDLAREFMDDRKRAQVLDQIASVDSDFTPSQTQVASGEDAYSAGPLTIGEGINVTLNDNSNWSVI